MTLVRMPLFFSRIESLFSKLDDLTQVSVPLLLKPLHADMAGRTAMMVSYWNQRFAYVPIALAVAGRRQLNPRGEVWQRVLEATGQPAAMHR